MNRREFLKFTAVGLASSAIPAFSFGKKTKKPNIILMMTDDQGWGDVGFDEQDLMFTREWLSGKAGTIAGGSSEIQKNIIAKRILGLPD